MKRAFEVGMLWVAFPSLLLPAAVSVAIGAAAGVADAAVNTFEVGLGIRYVGLPVVCFIIFASMVTNLSITLARWPTSPHRGLPWHAGVALLLLDLVLVLWLAHIVWEATFLDWDAVFLGTRVEQSPLDGVAFWAPFLTAVLSVAVLAGVLTRSHQREPHHASLTTTALVALLAYLVAAVLAIGCRFLIPLDGSSENAADWTLVVLGAPVSIVAAPVTWVISVVLSSRIDEGAAALVTAALFALPVVLNCVIVIRVLASQSFRLRWVPPIARR